MSKSFKSHKFHSFHFVYSYLLLAISIIVSL
jgi:hypothetical protein